ncbi:MAG: hypothetical protein SPL39_01495 [Selenomonadaceae bacterium]|nr:hypothetical protein [Selenomonadaceae bacterium]
MLIAPTLRKSILQAASSGQLTEQRAEDGDARDLLAAIRKEKALNQKIDTRLQKIEELLGV